MKNQKQYLSLSFLKELEKDNDRESLLVMGMMALSRISRLWMDLEILHLQDDVDELELR